MRIAIIGGHGKVAMLTVPLLVEAGHEVTSVIRNPDHEDEVAATGAHVIVADVEHRSGPELVDILQGHDVVIWSAGAGGGNPARTYSVDRDAAIRAMNATVAADVPRFIMVSYYGAGFDHGYSEKSSFYAYAQAKAAADDYLRGTGLHWTILGPSTLTDKPGSGKIDASGTKPKGKVSRANVAAVIAATVEHPEHVRERTLEFHDGHQPIEEVITSGPVAPEEPDHDLSRDLIPAAHEHLQVPPADEPHPMVPEPDEDATGETGHRSAATSSADDQPSGGPVPAEPVDFYEATTALPHWRLLNRTLYQHVDCGDFEKALEFVRRVGELAEAAGHHPDIDIRWSRVRLALTTHEIGDISKRDVQLGQQINAVGAELGCTWTTDGIGTFELAIDAMDIPAVRPFWAAVLGYDLDKVAARSWKDDEIVDPAGFNPTIWFQQMDNQRRQRNRIHVDFFVPADEAKTRIEHAVAAGGKVISDADAPTFWVLADPEKNEVCVCTWQGRG